MSTPTDTYLHTHPGRIELVMNLDLDPIDAPTRADQLLRGRRVTIANQMDGHELEEGTIKGWKRRVDGDHLRLSTHCDSIELAWDTYAEALPSIGLCIDWYGGDLLRGGFHPIETVEAWGGGPALNNERRTTVIATYSEATLPMWVSSVDGHGIKLVTQIEQLEPAYRRVLDALPIDHSTARIAFEELPRPIPPVSGSIYGEGVIACWTANAVVWQAIAELLGGFYPGTRYPSSPVNHYLAAARVWGRAAELIAPQIWDGSDLEVMIEFIREHVRDVGQLEDAAIAGREDTGPDLQGFSSGTIRGPLAKHRVKKRAREQRERERNYGRRH